MSKVILITGASTGLGAETAKVLAPDNNIIIHYNRSKDAAGKVAQEVKENGGKPFLVQADLTTEQACTAMIEKIKGSFSKLDVLVNNAGGEVERQDIRNLTWKSLLDTFSLNTFSTMKISSLCINLLEKSIDPLIVNITTVAIRHGSQDSIAYGASKGAIDVFTRGLAQTLAPKIRVNAVAPGVISTPLVKKYCPPEKIKEIIEATPIQRIGESYHIASTIKFIIENNFITGETIDVNGGLFMR
ncbi:MAG: SDR family oxidoreductase [Candidatus Humimicrobiaceae bacterium]